MEHQPTTLPTPAPVETVARKAPNVLLIVARDLGRFLHCCGQSAVHSPHIDRMADEGLHFTRCFSSSPSSSPSRTALFTGYHPHQNGVMGPASFGWSLRPHIPHIARRLAEDARYDTYLCGIQDENANHLHRLGYRHLLAQGRTEAAPICGALVDFLSAPEAQSLTPWFVVAGFNDVHRPWPEETAFDSAEVTVPGGLPDSPALRKDLARLHQAVRDMDLAVGRVLEALRTRRWERRTLVFFTTDHGCSLPRAKSTLYDAGIHVPLVLWEPGRDHHRDADELISTVDLVPTLMDYLHLPAPEDMPGRSFLPLIDGTAYRRRDAVLASLMYDAAYDPMHCVRTTTHKYIRSFAVPPEQAGRVDPRVSCTFAAGSWVRADCYDVLSGAAWQAIKHPRPTPPVEELYDLGNDPLEERNLVRQNDTTETLPALRLRLRSMMEHTGSPLLGGHVPPTAEQLDASTQYRPGGPMWKGRTAT